MADETQKPVAALLPRGYGARKAGRGGPASALQAIRAEFGPLFGVAGPIHCCAHGEMTFARPDPTVSVQGEGKVDRFRWEARGDGVLLAYPLTDPEESR